MAFVYNGVNIGQDLYQVQFSTVSLGGVPGGLTFSSDLLGQLMDFSAREMNTEIDVVPINGQGRGIYDNIPHGMQGNIVWTRSNAAIDSMNAMLMNGFFKSIKRVLFNIYTFVLDRNGVPQMFTFTNASLSDFEFGKYEGKKEVVQSVKFRADNMLDQNQLALSVLGNLPG